MTSHDIKGRQDSTQREILVPRCCVVQPTSRPHLALDVLLPRIDSNTTVEVSRPFRQVLISAHLAKPFHSSAYGFHSSLFHSIFIIAPTLPSLRYSQKISK